MDWVAIGGRIRKQREYLGLTREQFAENWILPPSFADIELGTKGYVRADTMPYCNYAQSIH